MKKVETTDEFIAVCAEGNQYRISEFTHFFGVKSHPQAEDAIWVPEVSGFRLPTGEFVNRLGENHFEVVGSGLQLQRQV